MPGGERREGGEREGEGRMKSEFVADENDGANKLG